jgi:hypothetical protein
MTDRARTFRSGGPLRSRPALPSSRARPLASMTSSRPAEYSVEVAAVKRRAFRLMRPHRQPMFRVVRSGRCLCLRGDPVSVASVCWQP